jgi:hypothetical protein
VTRRTHGVLRRVAARGAVAASRDRRAGRVRAGGLGVSVAARACSSGGTVQPTRATCSKKWAEQRGAVRACSLAKSKEHARWRQQAAAFSLPSVGAEQPMEIERQAMEACSPSVGAERQAAL